MSGIGIPTVPVCSNVMYVPLSLTFMAFMLETKPHQQYKLLHQIDLIQNKYIGNLITGNFCVHLLNVPTK